MRIEFLSWPDEDDEIREETEVVCYAADFETTTVAEDCRVWAWASCRIGDDALAYGTDIDSFMAWCKANSGAKVYFHNLRFDGKFIVHHLLSHGWRWVPDKTDCGERTFTTLISDLGQWYSVRIWFDATRSVEFLDSLKIIPLSIAAIPKAFGLPIEKLDLDYTAEREPGHELTAEEVAYITHDVAIAAKALDIMFMQGMDRMTAGSNAFADYKSMCGGKKRFRKRFPIPDYDSDLRKAGCYKGGFTAVNPAFAGKEVGEGISFDVNSLYPSVMAGVHGETLPYGEPLYFTGEYIADSEYPLYIAFIEADFTVKPDHIPCLQLKNSMIFADTEYIRDSDGMVPLCLTSVDMELFREQYDIWDIRYLRGYKFRASSHLYESYVEKWNATKVKASEEGNQGLRTIAKLQLNSLYGKMATNPVRQSKMPYLDDDGVVRYRLLPPEEREPVYLPAGAFITAYARAFTIRAAQRNYPRWLYSDTDSNYFLGTEPPEGLEIDPVELGAWKHEHTFSRFKALRAKSYCFEEGGELTIHCAGMPSRCHSSVTMDNFEYGSSFEGKLKPVDVPGGTILIDDLFTIREVKDAKQV